MGLAFEIKSQEETIILTPEQLIQMLGEKILSKDVKPDLEQMVLTMLGQLSSSRALETTNPLELLAMGMITGYYYRLFLEKNDVTILENTDAIVPD